MDDPETQVHMHIGAASLHIMSAVECLKALQGPVPHDLRGDVSELEGEAHALLMAVYERSEPWSYNVPGK